MISGLQHHVGTAFLLVFAVNLLITVAALIQGFGKDPRLEGHKLMYRSHQPTKAVGLPKG